MHEAINSLLTGSAALTALVGDRIYAGSGSDSPIFPYVIFDELGNEFSNSLSGDGGLRQSSLEVVSYIKSPNTDSALAITRAIEDALGYKRGVFGGTVVDIIYPSDTDESIIAPTSGEEFGTIERSHSFDVWWYK